MDSPRRGVPRTQCTLQLGHSCRSVLSLDPQCQAFHAAVRGPSKLNLFSTGFSMFSDGSLSSPHLALACETALYQTVDCADEAASLMTSGYVGSFENATETTLVCDAGCEASVAQLHDAVAASCVGSSANLLNGMPFVDLADLFWSNWNQTCFVDPDTGTNCNG